MRTSRRTRALVTLVTAAALVSGAGLVGGGRPATQPIAPAALTAAPAGLDDTTPEEVPVFAGGVASKKYTNAAYRSQAAAKAKHYKLRVRWVSGNACRGVSGSVGCYTGGSTRLTLSTRLKYYPKKTVQFVVAHEAAHHKTFLKCGTARPPIAGKRSEHVTDAYAAKVLKVSGATGYGYRSSDVRIAKKIHAGTCWSKQKKVKVTSTGVPFYTVTTLRKRYTLATGAKLAVVGKNGSQYVVRDTKGRVGYADAVAWKKPSRSLVVKHGGAAAWRYLGSSYRWMKVGEKYSYLRSHDSRYYLARDTKARLVLVAKKGF